MDDYYTYFKMPDLPLELINNILITRPVHPAAAIVKENRREWLIEYTKGMLLDSSKAGITPFTETEALAFVEALLNSTNIGLWQYYDGLHISCTTEDCPPLVACLCVEPCDIFKFCKFFRNFHSLETLSVRSRFGGEWGTDAFQELLGGLSLKKLEVWWGAKIAPEQVRGLPTLSLVQTDDYLESDYLSDNQGILKETANYIGTVELRDIGPNFQFKTQLIRTTRSGTKLLKTKVDIHQRSVIQDQFPDSKIVLVSH